MSQSQPQASLLRTLSAEALVVIGGLLSTGVTVLLNLFVERAFDFNLLSLSVWFVLPVGALIGGIAASSGYYGAALVTQTMPSRRLLAQMVIVSSSMWVIAKWLTYITLRTSDGTRIADIVSFFDFYKIMTESMQLTIEGTISTGELGGWGYARDATQLLGFMVGGIFVHLFLSDREACAACRKYAKLETILDAASPQAFEDTLATIGVSLPGLGDEAVHAADSKPIAGFSLRLARCPQCGDHWLRPGVVVGSNESRTTRWLRRYDLDAAAADAAQALKGRK